MEIEFLKFYEVSRDDSRGHLSGTLHIRFPELGLNLKGIYVVKKKDFFHVSLPNKKCYDKSTEKEINYSTFLFDEKEKNDELMKILKTQGREFLLKYLCETPQISPQELKASEKCVSPSVDYNNATASKEMRIIDKPQAAQKPESPIKAVQAISIASKNWQDPPKRSPRPGAFRQGYNKSRMV